MEMFIRLRSRVKLGASMVGIGDVGDLLKAIKDLIEISKKIEERTKKIEGIQVRLDRLEEGQGRLENAMHSLERTLDARLAADEIYILKERMLVLEKKLEEKVKT